MGKYIDTDRLKAKLDEYYREYQSKYMETRTTYTQGLIDAIDLAEQVIDSLQQDSRFPQYDNIVDKVFGAGNLESWEYEEAEMLVALAKEELLNSLQQEQPEVDLEKFTEKINTFQEKYKHPEIVSIKGAMAFMARMFYQYPNVARQWYDSLPKAIMD